MTKTLRYTTLKGLINRTTQFSLDTFLSKRMYHNKFGHINFKNSDKLNLEIIDLFNSFLNRDITNQSQTYGIFERLIINKCNLKISYIAGQNYPSEIRTLRGLIKWLVKNI